MTGLEAVLGTKPAPAAAVAAGALVAVGVASGSCDDAFQLGSRDGCSANQGDRLSTIERRCRGLVTARPASEKYQLGVGHRSGLCTLVSGTWRASRNEYYLAERVDGKGPLLLERRSGQPRRKPKASVQPVTVGSGQ
jgi:hypothetical protein